MEKLWVKDVQVGERASSVFLVAKKQQAKGRNDKAFLKLTLQDRTGQLDARVWHDAELVSQAIDAGDVVEAEGLVEAFQGRPQLTVERIGKAEGEHDRAALEYVEPEPAPAEKPARAAGGEGLLRELREELARVRDGHVRALLLGFVDDPEIGPRLRRAPAAKEIHHAYAGGLVEHVLSCVRLAQRLADHYPMADRDLLVAGAFLHDIGKVYELSYDKGGVGYTDEGRLVGHLVMTAQWIHERARSIPGFPRDLELHLTHIVLAHHGRLEYGSPKLPMTLEALLVHELDEIDSRVNSWLGQMARAQGERWAEPQKSHERLIWKAAAPTEEGRRNGPAYKQHRRPKGERKRKEKPAAAEARREPREPSVAAPPQEARPRAERPAPQAEGRAEAGERRGPKILKRAEGGKPAGEPKLTFKPFSALTAEEAESPAHPAAPEAEGVEGEVTPPPLEAAGAPIREEPEAATTESLPATGPEDLAPPEKAEG